MRFELEETLLSKIYAQPQELEVRAVLADAWSERGDPRGAFVARQLSGDLTPPDEALATALLGSLATELRVASVEFENGFPVRGTMERGSGSSSFDRPEWSTFTSLNGLEGFGPGLTSLERAEGVSLFAFAEWSRHRWPIPLRTLGTQGMAVIFLSDLPCRLESLIVEHIALGSEFELGHVYEALRDVSSLTSLRVAAPIFSTTSAEPRWPLWSEHAVEIPSLRSIEWEVELGELLLSSKDARFDSLRLRRALPFGDVGELEARLRALETPAKHFVIE